MSCLLRNGKMNTQSHAGKPRGGARALTGLLRNAAIAALIITLSLSFLSCRKAEPTVGGAGGQENYARSTSPLTGLPLADRSSAGRRAVAVKVENAEQARPQSGLDKAEVVYEEVVEGDITRFIALYLDAQATEIGPVRSARPMDVDILTFLEPLLVVSGGSPGVKDFLKKSALTFIDEDSGPYFWRARDRRAPHNLYTSSALLQSALKDLGMEKYAWGEDLFRFGEPPGGDESLYPSARQVEIKYPGSCGASYQYDPATGKYLRSVAGKPHTDKVSGAQLAPATVIVQYVDLEDRGVRDMAGSLSPDAVVVGSGDAMVFTAGRMYRAKWWKDSVSQRTLFLDDSNGEIIIKPGQVWIHLLPRSIRVNYS